MKQIPVEKIPPKGLMMAYFKKKLYFSPYEVAGGELRLSGQALDENEEPYECHFFDEKTEYRQVKRAARRDVIERILTEEEETEMPRDLLFVEDVLVKKEYAELPGIPVFILSTLNLSLEAHT